MASRSKNKVTWSVGRKLALAFGIMLTLLIVVGGFGINSLSQSHEATHKIVEEHIPDLMDIARIESDMLKARLKVGTYIATGDTEHLDSAAALHTKVEEHLTTLQASFYSEEKRTIVASIVTAYEEYDTRLDAAIDYYSANPTDLAGILSKLHEIDAYLEDVVLVDTGRLYEIESAETDELGEATHDLFLSMRTGGIVVVIIGIILSVAAAYYITRGIIRAVTHLSAAANRISGGDLDVVVAVRSDDEMGVLADTFNRMTSRLRDFIGTLEGRVAERTQELQEIATELAVRSQELETANIDLEEAHRRQEAINLDLQKANERTRRRAGQFQAVAEVGRAIAQLRDLENLLSQVTELISRHFGYYHAGIFLVDEARRYAVLRAANSEGGRRMLARNHKLAVGSQGIVGYVTGSGEPRIALDVGADAVFFDNPDMPETRSEMALPLKIGGQIVGALDVQSKAAGAFDDEDVIVLSVLVDQVAVAIQNARLFRQSQEALAEAEEAQRRYLQGAWQAFLQQRPDLQFEYTLEGVPSALDVELPTTRQAVNQEQTVAVSDLAGEDGHTAARAALSVPIKLRDQVIGVLDLHETDKARAWTEHEIALAQTVADQMAQAVEAARLFEQTQVRARHEQLVGQITTRMRAAPSVPDMLRVASEELGKALGVTRSVVRLHPQETSASPEEALL